MSAAQIPESDPPEVVQLKVLEWMKSWQRFVSRFIKVVLIPFCACQGRVATIQALSGTGSLRAAAAFLNRFCPGRVVYISDPTWGDHKAILSDAGVTWKTYRYFDSAKEGIDLAGMIEDLKNAPEGSVVLLHGEQIAMHIRC